MTEAVFCALNPCLISELHTILSKRVLQMKPSQCAWTLPSSASSCAWRRRCRSWRSSWGWSAGGWCRSRRTTSSATPTETENIEIFTDVIIRDFLMFNIFLIFLNRSWFSPIWICISKLLSGLQLHRILIPFTQSRSIQLKYSKFMHSDVTCKSWLSLIVLRTFRGQNFHSKLAQLTV